MKLSILVFSCCSVMLLGLSLTHAQSRSKRSIGRWFSDFFRKFQKKSRRRPIYYEESYDDPYSYGPATSYGTPPMAQYGTPYEPHHPSYIQTEIAFGDGGIGGGHINGGGGIGGGIGGGHINGGGGIGGGHINGGGYGGGDSPSLDGFGPIKESDIIQLGGSRDSYKSPSSPHILVSQLGFGGPTNGAANRGTTRGLSGTKNIQPLGNEVLLDSYAAPSNAHIQSSSAGSHSSFQGGFVAAAPFIATTTNVQYNSPPSFIQQAIQQNTIPSSSSNFYRAPSGAKNNNLRPNTGNIFAGPGSQSIIIGPGSGQGAGISYTSDLGPDDPIIEIVFQDGEPAPAPSPPVLDPSLYAPVKDDVEVYFIEYSPEDELNDFRNLDLSRAEPAILQNLPEELPIDLRNHLINSGILENAQIEVVDLNQAINDNSLDLNTRNALKAAYSRSSRQSRLEASRDQEVDVRVQRLNHDSKTPERVAEVLSGLKKFRKGTFAGVVEVNDKGSDKFIPLTVDGDKLPLPNSLSLEDKKVEGVLVLAPDEKDQTQISSQVQKGVELGSFSTNKHFYPPRSKKRVDVNWADVGNNGWIPIVNS